MKQKKNEGWVCQLCGKKISLSARILRLWRQSRSGRVHSFCFNQRQRRQGEIFKVKNIYYRRKKKTKDGDIQVMKHKPGKYPLAYLLLIRSERFALMSVFSYN